MKVKLLAATLAFAATTSSITAATVVNQYGRDTEVCDPVLIPTGGLAKRAVWNKMNWKPYVTHLYADGHREWFYDSFILNETQWYDSKKQETRVFVNAGGGQLPATQADWLMYLDHLFAANHDLTALDETIESFKATLGEPPLRHKVIIGTCFPCKDGRGTPSACEWKKFDWGTIDGEDMDFTRPDHRLIAGKWFIDQIIDRFESAGFKNIDLAGIYCQDESAMGIEDFLPEINDYIRAKGYRSYWIPYWWNNDEWALEWKDKFHFDIAYRQPNYFFFDRVGRLPSKSQLLNCIRQSKEYGLGLELEFETQDKSNGLHEVSPVMHQRLIDYIDAFENLGVWAESGVAHYCGSKGFIQMAQSADPVNQATVDRLCDIVRKRQKTFAGIDAPEVADNRQYAYPGEGRIFIPADFPEAAIYSLSGSMLHKGFGTFYCPAGIYIATDGAGRSMKVAVR